MMIRELFNQEELNFLSRQFPDYNKETELNTIGSYEEFDDMIEDHLMETFDENDEPTDDTYIVEDMLEKLRAIEDQIYEPA